MPAGPLVTLEAPARGRSGVPTAWWALAVVQVVIVATGVISLPKDLSRAVPDPVPSAVAPTRSTPSSPAATTADPPPDAAAINSLLSGRDTALLHRARSAFVDATAAGSPARREAVALFADIKNVPLAGWREEADLASLRPTSGTAGQFTVDATRSYQLRGYDPGGVPQKRRLTLAWRAGSWRVVGDTAAAGVRHELWESGPVVIGRGVSSLVLAHPGDRWRIANYARISDVAVAKVTQIWGAAWSRRVVVVVPATTSELGQLLGSTVDYSQIAALATAETVNGVRQTALAERVVVNPATFSQLSSLGQRIVMTHEVTHVASRNDTGQASPSWLVEGLADYVAYRDAQVPVSVIARDVIPLAHEGTLPSGLPSDSAFGPTTLNLAVAYELAWLACRHIVEKTSEHTLFAFYRAVGHDTGPQADVIKRQFAAVLATTPESFLSSWHRYVTAQLP